jgi:hypothetical protein
MKSKLVITEESVDAIAIGRSIIAASGKAGNLFDRFKQTQKQYPLQQLFFWYGLFSALTIGLLLWSAIAGFSALVVFLAAGIVWNRDELPVLPYCIAYQWLFIVAGYFYQLVAGYYPGADAAGDVGSTVLLSCTGLLVIVIGIRLGQLPFRRRFRADQKELDLMTTRYRIPLLFWIVIVVYTVNWFIDVSPMDIAFNVAQIIYRILEFRAFFLLILFLAIIKQRKGYRYGVAALVYTIVPKFASMMSQFSGVLVLVLIVVAGLWRPWSQLKSERRRNLRLVTCGITFGVMMFLVSIVWNGAVKPVWRPANLNNEVDGTPVEKIEAFTKIVVDSVPAMDWEMALETTVARLSSGTQYFSLVLLRVPDVIPYEEGALTSRAIEHILVPRFIYPEKINLGTDSWLVEKYAGRRVSDEEETSIGLGYMAQLYIDFGPYWMFAAIFVFGLLLGVIYGFYLLHSPSADFFMGMAAITFLQHFTSLEGELAKLLGGLVQSLIIYGIILYFFGQKMHQHLLDD